jgi:hypothetical protein
MWDVSEFESCHIFLLNHEELFGVLSFSVDKISRNNLLIKRDFQQSSLIAHVIHYSSVDQG